MRAGGTIVAVALALSACASTREHPTAHARPTITTTTPSTTGAPPVVPVPHEPTPYEKALASERSLVDEICHDPYAPPDACGQEEQFLAELEVQGLSGDPTIPPPPDDVQSAPDPPDPCDIQDCSAPDDQESPDNSCDGLSVCAWP